jgi:Uma2 family endonuclease
MAQDVLPTARRATYADIEALPAHVVGEIAHGVLHTMPRPRDRHGKVVFELQAELSGPFSRGLRGPGGWVFRQEPELHLGSNILVPDLAAWRRERFDVDPDVVGITTPPDWVCEVLSPSTARFDRTEKVDIYGTFGIGHGWYVDPSARTLDLYALTDGKWKPPSTVCDDAKVALVPFEAHRFSLSVLWALP